MCESELIERDDGTIVVADLGETDLGEGGWEGGEEEEEREEEVETLHRVMKRLRFGSGKFVNLIQGYMVMIMKIKVWCRWMNENEM